jgi:hypothetical protein
MMRWLRMVAALALAAVLLEGANWAVRDCPTGSNASDNCLWLRVRARFGLPASKLLRAGALEIAGLVILAGLWTVFRYVWPPRMEKAPVTSALQSHE